MATATANHADPTDLANRRLAIGLLLSIVLHGLVLSLQFGIPGVRPGPPAPLAVRLAPPLPVPVPPALAVTDEQPVGPGLAREPAQALGLRLVDPLAPAPAPPKPRRHAARRISRPRPPTPPKVPQTRVIAQDQHPDPGFAVPMPQPEPSSEQAADPMAAQDGSETGTGNAVVERAGDEDRRRAELAEQEPVAAQVAALAAEAGRARAAEVAAQQRAAAQALELERQRLAAEQQAAMLARQREAEEAQARRMAEQQRSEDDRSSQLARQRDEQARQAAESATRRQAEDDARRQAEREARRKTEELAQRQQAEQQARRRAEELEQQLAKQQARRRAEELEQQQTEEQARRRAYELEQQQLAGRRHAEELARQQAEQIARERAAQRAAQQQRAAEEARLASGAPSAAGNGAGGAGTPHAALPSSMFGSDAGNRARELVRGLDILGAPPPAVRQRGEGEGRRAVVSGPERDVPLRLYVDSFRQKVERNGALNHAQQSAARVRIDPLVSVTLRSDGSVEDVTILRSSGHPETDESVRRVVRVNARYSAFPPNVAARYDVIEIRRIWAFAEGLKLLEEVR
ncbi:MAG: TonB family protein [Massilia sp.]